MTQNEFDGMAVRLGIYVSCGLVALYGFFKTFATQRDFDKMCSRVDELEDKHLEAAVLAAELKTTIKSLERAVRDLTGFLRQTHNGPSCPAPLPYVASGSDDSK